MALVKSDKEFIRLIIKPIEIELKHIKELIHLHNLRVTRIEERNVKADKLIVQIEDWHATGRVATCPHMKKIEANSDEIVKGKITKKFILKIISITAIVIGIIWGLVQIFNHFG